MFRKMQKAPQFALLECGTQVEDGKRVLWRRYTLSMEGFECDITEVFPDRDMFIQGEQWLSRAVMNARETDTMESKRQYAANTSFITV
jgi:hypothetical protein